MHVCVTFGISRLESGRIIRLCAAGPILRTVVQYLIAFCSRSEVAVDDVISGRLVKLTDHSVFLATRISYFISV